MRRVTYFEQCTDLELRQLIEYGYRQLFPAGQIVCKEDDPGDSFYMRDLGLLDGDSVEQTPFIKIRKRIQVLFGI